MTHPGNGTAAGRNGTLFDGDEDRVDPRYAVVLMWILLLLMISAQTGLVAWKKHHQRSYDLVRARIDRRMATLAGLWLVPAIISTQLRFWTFLGVWAAYSVVTGHLIYVCMSRKADPRTPRTVYTWFLAVHKVSVGVGAAGYVLLILELFGAGPALALVLPRGTSLVLLWYGLYFGMLGRDCAEVASDRMALVLSIGRRLGSSVNSCGMCGGELKDFSHLGMEAEGVERAVQLCCKHSFHDLCIRGWTVVGKKDMCPVCREKVDLRGLYADRPWETSNLSWIQMLDALRYMVVWNPLIFVIFTAITHFFPHVHGHVAHRAGFGHALGPPPPAVLPSL